MTEQQRITSVADAVAYAGELTGLGALSGVIPSAERIIVDSDNTPFLAKQLIGTKAWKVQFDNVLLVLKSAVPAFKDNYPRRFIALVQEDTGLLWSIRSIFGEILPDMRPEPSAESAERQLGGEQEIYTGFPTVNPKISFLDALDSVLTQGTVSPFVAREFYAVYVIETEMRSAPRAVWAITLRGIPPLPVRVASVPAWQRNHMRSVVDANTAKLLFSINSPQPME